MQRERDEWRVRETGREEGKGKIGNGKERERARERAG